MPVPWTADWDADGDLDVLALGEDRLHVWTQDRSAFPEAPQHSLAIPVVADRKRRLDVTYAGHAADINGDGRADCVMIAGDYATDDVRTQVLVFLQSGEPLFGAKGVPNRVDPWGPEHDHDWVTWREMLPKYLDEMVP